MEEKAKEIILKHAKELAKELILEVLIPEAEKQVIESSGKVDDLIFPMFKKAILEALAKI